MNWTLSLAVTSELPFSQRKESEDPEAEQDRRTELNSNKSVLLADAFTLDTGTVGVTQNSFIQKTLQTKDVAQVAKLNYSNLNYDVVKQDFETLNVIII